MEIKKQFAPITIHIDTKEELTILKELAHASVSANEYTYRMFLRRDKGEKRFMDLARKILEL